MTTLGAGTNSIAYAISSNGLIAGVLGNGHAFLYSSGVIQDLGTLGGASSSAFGVNSSGEVVGASTTSSGATHAFIYSKGVMTDLGTLGGTNSAADAINDSGVIVGSSETVSNQAEDGFVYTNGTMADLTILSGGEGGAGLAINASGQILTQNGLLLIPTNESIPDLDKTLGNPSPNGCLCGNPSSDGQFGAGEPISVGTGNVFYEVTDYTTAGPNPLALVRSYNSLAAINGAFSGIGLTWLTNFDRRLVFTPISGQPTSVIAYRPDGQGLTFKSNGGVWATDSDLDYTLTENSSTWALKGPDDTVETYNLAGQVTTITLRNGYTQNLVYGGCPSPVSVTDSYNRTLTFSLNSNCFIETAVTPDGTELTYGYTTGGANGTLADRLTTVSYSTSPATSQTYLYGNSTFPYALTGVIDENNNAYATWTYDAFGRGQSSKLGNGANLTTLVYGSNGTATVTNALGVTDTYTFTTLQGVPKLTEISRAATSTTAAATRTFTYDTNGFLNSETDWNGNKTSYVNNSQGNPTTITYAVGSPQAFTKTISYDSNFIRLPHQIVTPGLTTTFVYDASGNTLSRTDLDTTTNTAPYSTSGQTRVTAYTWSATGQETSVQLPRTDVAAKTSFTYDGTGALTKVTDALNHSTLITLHTEGGLPETVVDASNVVTNLRYDARLNLHTSAVNTAQGTLTTTYNHDAANNLTSVQLPDGSTLTYTYDTAHRRTSTSDLLGNSISSTLDALGDETQVLIKNSAGTVGVPGSICASGGETNWNKRSERWREARSIVQNRL
jgi:probable HAF family extracellular repeat protein/YD repeat-containing protein